MGPRQMKEPQGFLPAENRSAGRDQSVSARRPALPPGLVVRKGQGREKCGQKGSRHTRVHTHASACAHTRMCMDTRIQAHTGIFSFLLFNGRMIHTHKCFLI